MNVGIFGKKSNIWNDDEEVESRKTLLTQKVIPFIVKKKKKKNVSLQELFAKTDDGFFKPSKEEEPLIKSIRSMKAKRPVEKPDEYHTWKTSSPPSANERIFKKRFEAQEKLISEQTKHKLGGDLSFQEAMAKGKVQRIRPSNKVVPPIANEWTTMQDVEPVSELVAANGFLNQVNYTSSPGSISIGYDAYKKMIEQIDGSVIYGSNPPPHPKIERV